VDKPITMSDVRLAAGEGKLSAHDVLAAVNAILRQRRRYSRQDAIMIAGIIQDEIGGEVCTPEWSQAAADRIVSALEQGALTK
jgi:hypothetical protein